MTTANRQRPPGDPVTAIREAEATGETARQFADIRAVLGVNVVNLIWRHLATLPDCLPWAWAAVRPVYASGLAKAQSEALKGGLVLPDLPPVPRASALSAGLDAADLAAIRQVIEAYDHTNAMALLTLTALHQRMAGEPAADPLPLPAGEAAPRQPEALPPVAPFEQLPAHVVELIETVNRYGDPTGGEIVASMYRTLSRWPASLALIQVHLAPAAADGRIEAAVRATVEEAARMARRLPVDPGPPPATLSDADRRTAARSIRQFTTTAIGRMVPITALLKRTFPA